MNGEELEFIVGSERKLQDVLAEEEVAPLLRCAVEAGLSGAAVLDSDGDPLWRFGNLAAPGSDPLMTTPLYLEGEPVGEVRFESAHAKNFLPLARAIGGSLQVMLNANLKRMLTTEIHTHVVNQSYEELLEKNRQLAVSEARYREVAENLEIKVRERTEELKKVYARMVQQEKMASVGQLAAGMAHEINNPLGFITSNLRSLQRYVARFMEMIRFFDQAPLPPLIAAEAHKLGKNLKLDFIRADAEELLTQSISGAERMKKIVADLKSFSHLEESSTSPIDVNAELDRTFSVMAHEIPPGAEILRHYGEVPSFLGDPARICQAFFNILRNAFQSRQEGLRVQVTTEYIPGSVRITIADNGPGIAEEIRSRIFEPFFTTRDVGQGMGLGLSVAHENVKDCGGTLRAEPAAGAVFVIEFPFEEEPDAPIR